MLATFTVNVDYDAEAPFDFNDGIVTLREAIEIANQDAIPDTILLAPTLNGQTITLGIDEIGNNLNPGFNGELDITEAVTINALEQNITIDASGNDNDVNLDNGGGSQILDIRLSGGTSTSEVLIRGLAVTGSDSHDNIAFSSSGENPGWVS